jgi:hypothetical protein
MIVKSSFLPRLTAKGKEFCKLGHQLETPFTRKLLQHSKEGLSKFEVEKIYRVVFVGKSNEMFIKASCDFVAGAVIDGEKQLVGVECKARVTPGTHQRERAHTEFLSHFNNMSLMNTTTTTTTTTTASPAAPTGTTSSRGTELYSVLEAASVDFHVYINSSHEAVQLVNQAYI